ncbi:MAG: hypothetical protein QM802_16240 [Agriterribacter sp.]
MPMRLITLCLFAILFCTITKANDYEDAWQALHRNDRKTAIDLLKKAMTDPATSVDAYLTYIYVCGFEGKDEEPTDYLTQVYQKLKDPNPYLFSQWFNEAVLGGYGKKTDNQLKLIEAILNDPKCNGSLKAAAYYVYFWHFQGSNNIPRGLKETSKMGAVWPGMAIGRPLLKISRAVDIIKILDHSSILNREHCLNPPQAQMLHGSLPR